MTKRALSLILGIFLFVAPALAQRSHSSRPYYGGGKHTESHGGHYQGEQNSHHKGGHYKNPNSNNRYGKHKP